MSGPIMFAGPVRCPGKGNELFMLEIAAYPASASLNRSGSTEKFYTYLSLDDLKERAQSNPDAYAAMVNNLAFTQGTVNQGIISVREFGFHFTGDKIANAFAVVAQKLSKPFQTAAVPRPV